MPKSKDAPASLRRWLLSGEPPRPLGAADAQALAAAAREQGLVGLLRGAMPSWDDWPAPVRDGLKEAHHAALARGVRQLDLAARVLALLEARGLRALPLKGAATAEALYDSVADRPMSDVDILVLDDPGAAPGVLEGQGFREVRRADHASAFSDPLSGGILELHWSVTSCPGLFPLDREGLWARSRPASGQVRRIPSAEDLLVQLSLHAAFQHGLVLSLVQYLDFRRLLERTHPDPERVLELAATSRAEAAVAAALATAEAVVGAHAPLALASRFRLSGGLARRLSRRLEEPLSMVGPSPPALGRVRWELLRGRRLELARRSLFVSRPGPPEPMLVRGARAASRAGRLLGRYAASAVALGGGGLPPNGGPRG